MERIEMVEAFANGGDALVLIANFNADRALADAWQHDIGIKNCGQQPVRHRIAMKASVTSMSE